MISSSRIYQGDTCLPLYKTNFDNRWLPFIEDLDNFRSAWRWKKAPDSVICWYLLQTVWTKIRPKEMSGGPTCLSLLWYSWKIFFWRKKISKRKKRMQICSVNMFLLLIARSWLILCYLSCCHCHLKTEKKMHLLYISLIFGRLQNS